MKSLLIQSRLVFYLTLEIQILRPCLKSKCETRGWKEVRLETSF